MRRLVSQNKNRGSSGVTLVEVMISVVILLIVSLGMIQATLLSIDSNIQGELRDEAVRIASETMARQRDTFSSLADTAGVCNALNPATVTRSFRNMNMTFNICGIVANQDIDTKQVTIRVTWTYRGTTSTHTIITYVRNS